MALRKSLEICLVWFVLLADAQHTTDQRQTESCGYQRQGINAEEMLSIATEKIKNILQEIKLKNVAQREQELRIDTLYVLQNTSKCPEEERRCKTINEEEHVQQQELFNQLQLSIRQPQEQQQNQSRQIEALTIQNENHQEQQRQQREQLNNLSSKHQLILQQLQVQQKEQQAKHENLTLELKAIQSNQEQGRLAYRG